MEKIIEQLIEIIKADITKDLNTINDFNNVYFVTDEKNFLHGIVKLIFDAYNTYQAEERDFIDYIYDINNQDDVAACVKSGMTAKEISELYINTQNNTTPFFYFGVNYKTPQPIATYDDLIINLISWLNDLLPCVISYPYACKSYEKLYVKYITNKILDDK